MDVVIRKYYLTPEEQKEYRTKFFITFESEGKVLEIYDQSIYDISNIELPPYFFLAKENTTLNWATLSEDLYDEYVNQWVIKQGDNHNLGRWEH